MMAQRAASRHRLAGDMVTIAGALEEYKKDFGDYPQVDAPNTGFAVLGKALLGTYGDGVLPGPPPQANDPNDPPTFVSGTTYMPGDCVQTGGAKYVAMVENTGAPASHGERHGSPFDPNDLSRRLRHPQGPRRKKNPALRSAGEIPRPRMRVSSTTTISRSSISPRKRDKPNLSKLLQPSGLPPFIGLNGYGAFRTCRSSMQTTTSSFSCVPMTR